VDRRPDSIGKAIPNAEILVLREDGSPCAANEPGELVHRGALVGMGYWNDHEKTAERYKPLPANTPGRDAGLVLPEIAVFSGDTVRRDEEGFLYFIGRRDEMMKTSGYRVSPTEVEEVLYATQLVGECVAFGVDHPTLGQAIQVIATPPPGGSLDTPNCSPNAAAGCPPTWCRPASSCGKARCRATPMARSTASLASEFLARSQEAGVNVKPAGKS
jgi:acyl-coenzyme A synthetase/AMP-(fatty) acid ligase